jgi:hypothetical protein
VLREVAAAIDRHPGAREANAHRRLSQAQAIDYLRAGQFDHRVRAGKGPTRSAYLWDTEHPRWNAHGRSYSTRRHQVGLGGGSCTWRGGRGGKKDDPARPRRHALGSSPSDRAPKQKACAEARYGKSSHEHTPNALATPASSLNRSTDAHMPARP